MANLDLVWSDTDVNGGVLWSSTSSLAESDDFDIVGRGTDEDEGANEGEEYSYNEEEYDGLESMTADTLSSGRRSSLVSVSEGELATPSESEADPLDHGTGTPLSSSLGELGSTMSTSRGTENSGTEQVMSSIEFGVVSTSGIATDVENSNSTLRMPSADHSAMLSGSYQPAMVEGLDWHKYPGAAYYPLGVHHSECSMSIAAAALLTGKQLASDGHRYRRINIIGFGSGVVGALETIAKTLGTLTDVATEYYVLSPETLLPSVLVPASGHYQHRRGSWVRVGSEVPVPGSGVATIAVAFYEANSRLEFSPVDLLERVDTMFGSTPFIAVSDQLLDPHCDGLGQVYAARGAWRNAVAIGDKLYGVPIPLHELACLHYSDILNCLSDDTPVRFGSSATMHSKTSPHLLSFVKRFVSAPVSLASIIVLLVAATAAVWSLNSNLSGTQKGGSSPTWPSDVTSVVAHQPSPTPLVIVPDYEVPCGEVTEGISQSLIAVSVPSSKLVNVDSHGDDSSRPVSESSCCIKCLLLTIENSQSDGDTSNEYDPAARVIRRARYQALRVVERINGDSPYSQIRERAIELLDQQIVPFARDAANKAWPLADKGMRAFESGARTAVARMSQIAFRARISSHKLAANASALLPAIAHEVARARISLQRATEYLVDRLEPFVSAVSTTTYKSIVIATDAALEAVRMWINAMHEIYQDMTRSLDVTRMAAGRAVSRMRLRLQPMVKRFDERLSAAGRSMERTVSDAVGSVAFFRCCAKQDGKCKFCVRYSRNRCHAACNRLSARSLGEVLFSSSSDDVSQGGCFCSRRRRSYLWQPRWRCICRQSENIRGDCHEAGQAPQWLFFW